MKFKKAVIYLVKLIGFVAVCYIVIFIFNEYKAYELPYGKRANEIRISANIPTIKSLMYSTNVNSELLGNQWISIRKAPQKGEVLHIWKYVIRKDDSGALYEERDAFRKMEENGIIYQLNLNSIVEKDTILEQYGILFEVSSSYENPKKVSGIELKNLISKWKIFELK